MTTKEANAKTEAKWRSERWYASAFFFCYLFGLGLPAFASLLAAAAFWSALRTDLFCLPGLGWQLPFSPADLPGVGSKPGQQCWAEEGFFLVAVLVGVGMFSEMRLLETWPAIGGGDLCGMKN